MASKNVDFRQFKNKDPTLHMLNEKNIPITKKYISDVLSKYGIKYKVNDIAIFQLAMIHDSYLKPNKITPILADLLNSTTPISDKLISTCMPLQKKSYGRLEYLGDGIIKMLLGDYLYFRYEEQSEAFLTETRIKLENKYSLSDLSKKMELDKYLVIARNLEMSGSREENKNLTEDIFESFLGALYIDASSSHKNGKSNGFDICEQFLRNIIEKELNLSEIINTNRNYKSQLMKLFHVKRWGEPQYIDVNRTQTQVGKKTVREFFIKIKKSDGEQIGFGSGSTKKIAEQNAAENALYKLGELNDNSEDEDDYYGELSSDNEEYFEET